MGESTNYMVSLEQLVRLRDAGSLSDAEFAQERSQLLKLHQPVVADTDGNIERKPNDGGGRAIFFMSYAIMMIPTYVLPYFGSNSLVANVLWPAFGRGGLPVFWLHVLALYLLVVICWHRGSRIEAPWLPAFPAIAALFDLVPFLNWIPLVPTGCHIAALIIGVSRPTIDESQAGCGKSLIGLAGFVAIAACGFFSVPSNSPNDQTATPNDTYSTLNDTAADADQEMPIAVSQEPLSDESQLLESAPAQPEAHQTVNTTPGPVPNDVVVQDSLKVATLRALDTGRLAAWQEGRKTGTATPSAPIAITGGTCRTLIVTDIAEGRATGSVSTTWCRQASGSWSRR